MFSVTGDGKAMLRKKRPCPTVNLPLINSLAMSLPRATARRRISDGAGARVVDFQWRLKGTTPKERLAYLKELKPLSCVACSSLSSGCRKSCTGTASLSFMMTASTIQHPRRLCQERPRQCDGFAFKICLELFDVSVPHAASIRH